MMKEFGWFHQNGNKKWRPEVSVVQLALILIVCLWLVYQIHGIHTRDCGCEEVENNFRNKKIGRLLGRKGGLKSFYNSEVKDLYEEGHQITSNGQGKDDTFNVEVNYGELLTKEGETGKKLQEIKENNQNISSEDEDEKIGGRNKTEEEFLVKVKAVVLKNAEKKLEVSRMNEDNGVQRRDSGPSRRTDMQIDSSGTVNVSGSGNVSKEKEECRELCSKKIDEMYSSEKSEGKAVDEEMKVSSAFESGQAGMRELLQIKYSQ